MLYQFSENQWGDRYIDSLSRQTFANVSAEHYFASHMDINFDKSDVLYVIVGSDSGLLIDYFRTHMQASGTRAVFVEPDDVYEILTAECDHLLNRDGTLLTSPEHEQNQPDIRLHSHGHWRREVMDGRDKSWFQAGELRIIESQSSQKDYTQIYMPLFKEIRSAIDRRSIDIVEELGNKTYVRTQMINAADSVLPLLTSADFGKGYTAVILGGGPSLDTYLDWVIENREKLFVIAVSRLSSRLQAIDFKPDAIVHIDPYPTSYDVSKHGVVWTDVPLLCGFHTAPQLLQEWQGPRFYLGRRLPWTAKDDVVALNTIAAPGPTVSHTATLVASSLGFSQIYMIGVDMCYSSVTTHAKGSPEEAFQKLPSLYDAQVETYSGSMAGSIYAFERGVRSLEHIGKAANQNTTVLFNLNEYAAKIDCIPHVKTSDITLPDSKADFSEYVKQYEEYDNLKNFKELEIELKAARAKYHYIKRSCQQAHRIIDRMYSPAGSVDSARYMKKLDRIDRKIETRATDFIYAIKLYQSDVLIKLKKPSGFDEMKDTAMKEWISAYYEIFATGAESFLTMIADLECRIQIRQAELEETKSVEALIDIWKKDLTPGRILQFDDAAISRLNESDKKRVEIAKDQFLNTIHNDDTALSRKLKSFNLNIDHCMRSLIYIFNIKSKVDLQSLSDNLLDSDWPGNVIRTFAIGLIADIDSRHDNAINQYQLVIDACSDRLDEQTDTLESMQRIIEESLVRMTQAYLNLKQPDAACTTLGTLCEMLPQYFMAYAKLLNLCGRTDTALEILNIYVEHYPTHWQAAQLIADILSAADRQEEAELASQLSITMRKTDTPEFNKAA